MILRCTLCITQATRFCSDVRGAGFRTIATLRTSTAASTGKQGVSDSFAEDSQLLSITHKTGQRNSRAADLSNPPSQSRPYPVGLVELSKGRTTNQERNQVAAKEISRLIDKLGSPAAENDIQSLLPILARVQKADGLCIDIDIPSNAAETKLFKALHASRSLNRLSDFISPGQRIAGSDDSLDIAIATCLGKGFDISQQDRAALEMLSKMASVAQQKAQHRTSRRIAAILEAQVLVQYSSSHRDRDPDLALLKAYVTAMSAFAVACDWDTIWKKRKLLMFASKHLLNSQSKSRIVIRPDLILLKAAACKDLRTTQTIQSVEKEIKYAKQRFERFRLLHQDAIELGMRPDKRWAAALVSGLMRNATSATFNGEVRAVASSLELPQLLDTRQAFLKDLFELCKNEKGQEAVVFCILEAEVHVVTALMNDSQPKETKLIARLTEHMRSVIETADKLAADFSFLNTHGKQCESQRHKIFWLQSARASVMKASHAIIQLQLCLSDVEGAFTTLEAMMQRIVTSITETSTIHQAVSTILHREQRNKRLARSSIINILLQISKGDMSLQHERSRGLELMAVLRKSLEMGLWDVARADVDSVQSISPSSKGSPAVDMAKICIRLMGAMSPAQSRTHAARHGAKYRTSASNACDWQQDFMALLEQIVVLRARAIERSGQMCTDAAALGAVVTQPWRSAFKNRIDDEPLRVARIVWSLTSSWQPTTKRISAQARASDPEQSENAKQLSITFCRDLQWLVDHVLTDFGLAPRTWRITHDTLLRHLRHLPTPEGRKQAIRLFEAAMSQALASSQSLHSQL